jgi:hypothetical protein
MWGASPSTWGRVQLEEQGQKWIMEGYPGDIWAQIPLSTALR